MKRRYQGYQGYQPKGKRSRIQTGADLEALAEDAQKDKRLFNARILYDNAAKKYAEEMHQRDAADCYIKSAELRLKTDERDSQTLYYVKRSYNLAAKSFQEIGMSYNAANAFIQSAKYQPERNWAMKLLDLKLARLEFKKCNRYEEEIQCLIEIAKVQLGHNDRQNIPWTMNNLAFLYEKKGMFDEAGSAFEKSMEYRNREKARHADLDNAIRCYKCSSNHSKLSQLHKLKGNFRYTKSYTKQNITNACANSLRSGDFENAYRKANELIKMDSAKQRHLLSINNKISLAKIAHIGDLPPNRIVGELNQIAGMYEFATHIAKYKSSRDNFLKTMDLVTREFYKCIAKDKDFDICLLVDKIKKNPEIIEILNEKNSAIDEIKKRYIERYKIDSKLQRIECNERDYCINSFINETLGCVLSKLSDSLLKGHHNELALSCVKNKMLLSYHFSDISKYICYIGISAGMKIAKIYEQIGDDKNALLEYRETIKMLEAFLYYLSEVRKREISKDSSSIDKEKIYIIDKKYLNLKKDLQINSNKAAFLCQKMANQENDKTKSNKLHVIAGDLFCKSAANSDIGIYKNADLAKASQNYNQGGNHIKAVDCYRSFEVKAENAENEKELKSYEREGKYSSLAELCYKQAKKTRVPSESCIKYLNAFEAYIYVLADTIRFDAGQEDGKIERFEENKDWLNFATSVKTLKKDIAKKCNEADDDELEQINQIIASSRGAITQLIKNEAQYIDTDVDLCAKIMEFFPKLTSQQQARLGQNSKVEMPTEEELHATEEEYPIYKGDNSVYSEYDADIDATENYVHTNEIDGYANNAAIAENYDIEKYVTVEDIAAENDAIKDDVVIKDIFISDAGTDDEPLTKSSTNDVSNQNASNADANTFDDALIDINGKAEMPTEEELFTAEEESHTQEEPTIYEDSNSVYSEYEYGADIDATEDYLAIDEIGEYSVAEEVVEDGAVEDIAENYDIEEDVIVENIGANCEIMECMTVENVSENDAIKNDVFISDAGTDDEPLTKSSTNDVSNQNASNADANTFECAPIDINGKAEMPTEEELPDAEEEYPMGEDRNSIYAEEEYNGAIEDIVGSAAANRNNAIQDRVRESLYRLDRSDVNFSDAGIGSAFIAGSSLHDVGYDNAYYVPDEKSGKVNGKTYIGVPAPRENGMAEIISSFSDKRQIPEDIRPIVLTYTSTRKNANEHFYLPHDTRALFVLLKKHIQAKQKTKQDFSDIIVLQAINSKKELLHATTVYVQAVNQTVDVHIASSAGPQLDDFHVDSIQRGLTGISSPVNIYIPIGDAIQRDLVSCGAMAAYQSTHMSLHKQQKKPMDEYLAIKNSTQEVPKRFQLGGRSGAIPQCVYKFMHQSTKISQNPATRDPDFQKKYFSDSPDSHDSKESKYSRPVYFCRENGQPKTIAYNTKSIRFADKYIQQSLEKKRQSTMKY